jgi:dTDP-4-amino-4,6-dideoxygalactose transaminase
MQTRSIPLVDLERQFQKLRPELLPAIEAVFKESAFIQGPFLKSFEDRFTVMHGAQYGAGCSNGTAALQVLLQASGLKPGDEAITTPHTFFATAESMLQIGVTPRFVDIDPRTYCIDPAKIEAAITPATRAIVPVHIYGIPCDLDAIREIAKRRNLKVIEDCAQSHFAKYRGRYVGTTTDGAAFSFYPGKNLGAAGDAGFVFSPNAEVHALARKLMDHGRTDKYRHDTVASNHRMDALQAAILSVKLGWIAEWTETRRRHARQYSERLSAKGFSVAQATPGSDPVWHLFVVETSNREEVMAHLKSHGIQSGIHYPIPLHLQPALESLGNKKGSFPNCERASERILSLPICGDLKDDEREQVVERFLEVARP